MSTCYLWHVKKCKDTSWVSGLQFPFLLAVGRFMWTRLEYSICIQTPVKEIARWYLLKNRSLRAGLFLPWCHYLQFLDVISVRLIYLSQNGWVYWKRVPQKEFICVFAGVAVWAVTCVLILQWSGDASVPLVILCRAFPQSNRCSPQTGNVKE